MIELNKLMTQIYFREKKCSTLVELKYCSTFVELDSKKSRNEIIKN